MMSKVAVKQESTPAINTDSWIEDLEWVLSQLRLMNLNYL